MREESARAWEVGSSEGAGSSWPVRFWNPLADVPEPFQLCLSCLQVTAQTQTSLAGQEPGQPLAFTPGGWGAAFKDRPHPGFTPMESPPLEWKRDPVTHFSEGTRRHVHAEMMRDWASASWAPQAHLLSRRKLP